MSGGLMQLVANGAQDVFLTNDPQITFWKRAFKRHTNFSIESIAQTFTGGCQFGGETNCQVIRSGDLIYKAYLEVQLPEIKGTAPFSVEDVYQPYVGELLIDSVSISIGGQVIDKHYGEWLHIWNELSCKNREGYERMVGKVVRSRTPVVFVPLSFWWNNSPGMALPLIALQFHEVRLNFKFNDLSNLLTPEARKYHDENKTLFTTPQPYLNAKVFIDYVYIDMDERTRFAQSTHEYLIQQVQKTSESVRSENMRVPLNFNHPCKELIWFVSDNQNEKKKFDFTYKNQADQDLDLDSFVKELKFAGTSTKDATGKVTTSSVAPEISFDFSDRTGGGEKLFDSDFNSLSLNGKAVSGTTVYGDSTLQGKLGNGVDNKVTFEKMVKHVLDYDLKVNLGPVTSALIKLNNHERFTARCGEYFNLVQPQQHHTNTPRSNGLYVYSFALEPESDQPTGSCNFSRIDNAVLELTLHRAVALSGSTYKVTVYATNFNVLRIMGGMGGVAFAN